MKKLGVSEKAPAGVNSTVDIESMVANTFAAAVPAAAESLKNAEERTSSVDSSSSSSASSVASAASVALLPSPRRRAPGGQLEEGSAEITVSTPVPSPVGVCAVPDAGASSGDAAAPLISPTESGLTGEYSAAGPAATPAFREAGTLSEEDGVSKNFPLDGHGAPPSSTSATPLLGVSEDSVVAARGTASATPPNANSVVTGVVIGDEPGIPEAGATTPLVAAGEEASAVAGGQPPSEQNRAAADADDDTLVGRFIQADEESLTGATTESEEAIFNAEDNADSSSLVVATDEAAAVIPTQSAASTATEEVPSGEDVIASPSAEDATAAATGPVPTTPPVTFGEGPSTLPSATAGREDITVAERVSFDEMLIAPDLESAEVTASIGPASRDEERLPVPAAVAALNGAATTASSTRTDKTTPETTKVVGGMRKSPDGESAAVVVSE
ncbi:hypothetical protein FOZ63_032609, partial [Perkinsus olseni]